MLLKPDQGHARYPYMREEGRIYFQNDFERLVAAERCSSEIKPDERVIV